MEDEPIGAKIIRVLRGGQVTLPIEFRRRLGIEDGSMVTMAQTQDGALIVRPLKVLTAETEGSPWLRELYERFAPVRQEILEKGYTEEEINRWIDEAVAEVRRERAKREAENATSSEDASAIRQTA
jgi:AbrB family looped-hinge helix DNA binding protein